jgi:hypothetical protein
MIRDYLGALVHEGDLVAYGANGGIRVGRITRINKYVGDHDTTYTFQINREYEKGKFKKQTISYEQHKLWKVEL